MPLIYGMADITVSASRKPEAFGRVAVEGQAMKSLVIATNLGAAVETVIPNKTGFLIEPNNPQQLEKMIQHALELADDEKNYITKNARQHVEKHFSKKQMLSNTLNIYKECLQ
jgi:glycosyltransferase involved in cell wall biosynthesis